MLNLNRMFSFRNFKILMAILFFALAIVAIWFLGPLLGFGDARPLASVEARIIFISLALCCLLGLAFSVPPFLLLALTACVIFWVIGPYLLLGEGYPLASVTARCSVIGGVLLLTLLYGVWKLLLALKNNPKLLDTLFSSKEVKSADEIGEVSATIREAAIYMRQLRKNDTLLQRFFSFGKTRGELPWYMAIGTQGAGKTTAILSSGQHFPLPEQLNKVCKERAPTRNCECWFANEALFIDTAGKYIHSSDEQPEWNGIVKAIKKYRPVQALNGVIVTLSVTDVMGKNKTELFDLAAKVRARLDTIRSTLGVRFPVYMLITKVDRLVGFAEYFRSLTEQEREQLWGVTFPWGGEANTVGGALREQVEAEFSLLENRLERAMTVRQQEEYSNADRKRMYALPQDFRMLLEGVAEMAQTIFFASRYDENQGYTLLRGIYFVSSHQPEDSVMINNSTLIQKWRNFIAGRPAAPLAYPASLSPESEALVKDVAWGRHYFLKTLFSEIILKDADLVQRNLRVETKYRFQNFVGHALGIAVCIWLLNGVYHSYHHNGGYLKAAEAKVVRLEAEVKKDLKAENRLPLLLNMAQALPEFSGLNVLHPGLSFRYGLYVGKQLTDEADGLYHYFLRRLLFPQIESQAHEALQNALYERDRTAIYLGLKRYLMLAGQGDFDRAWLIGEIARDWDSAGKLQPYEERSLFIAHLEALFHLPNWRQYGQAADKNLVAEAREVLNRDTLTNRLYERVMTQMQAEAPENLTLSKMTDEDAGQIFTLTDAELAEKGMPGLFTWEGYHQVFKKKLGEMVRNFQAEDSWVTGSGSAQDALKTLKIDRGAGVVDPLREALMKLYLKEYTRRWQTFLQNIRLKSEGAGQNNTGLSFDIYMLRALVSTNSPLVNLARRAVRETTLAVDQQDNLLKSQDLSSSGLSSGRLVDAAAKLNLALAAHEKKVLRQGVDNYFVPLREFVGGGEKGTRAASGTKLHQIMGVLNDQYTLLVISDSALKNGNLPAVSDAGQRLSAESAIWPDPFKYLIAPLLNGAYRRVNHQIVYSSNKTIASGPGEVCRNTLQGRYPFADNSEEVSLRDFERFFAAGGVLDDYFQKKLADKVDTAAKPWRYRGDINTQDSEALDVFEQAEAIRSAFFRNGGRMLGIDFTVAVPYLDPSVTQLNLNFDGSVMGYSHGPVTPKRFHWPGARAESVVNMSTKPRILSQENGLTLTGPWALMRWLDTVNDIATSPSGQPVLLFNLHQRPIKIEVTGLTWNDELIVDLLKNFNCPGAF